MFGFLSSNGQTNVAAIMVIVILITQANRTRFSRTRCGPGYAATVKKAALVEPVQVCGCMRSLTAPKAGVEILFLSTAFSRLLKKTFRFQRRYI
jgi:hypothetical protein